MMSKMKVYTGKAIKELFAEHNINRVKAYVNLKLTTLDISTDIQDFKHYIITDTEADIQEAMIEEVEFRLGLDSEAFGNFIESATALYIQISVKEKIENAPISKAEKNFAKDFVEFAKGIVSSIEESVNFKVKYWGSSGGQPIFECTKHNGLGEQTDYKYIYSYLLKDRGIINSLGDCNCRKVEEFLSTPAGLKFYEETTTVPI